MTLPISDDHPIRDLFAGLVENTFWTEIGVCEPRLTDYLAELMIEFLHIDRLEVIRNAFGKSLDQMAMMLALSNGIAPETNSAQNRLMYRYIGDFALFWAGIFPEHLKSRRARRRDLLGAYVAQGKESYAQAASLTQGDAEPPASLLNSLSEEFESCVHGLGLVRRSWESGLRATDTDLLY